MPRDEPNGPPALGRRELGKLLGACALFANGCGERPAEQILPFVRQPPEARPGVPVYYATSMVLDGFATGLLVASRDGRPTKVEGNPDHPASLGATRAWEQAAILSLYDPDRAKAPLVRRGAGDPAAIAAAPTSWATFVDEVARPADQRLWLVMPPQSSPLVEGLLNRIRQRHPRARWSFYAPLARRGAYAAARLLYGRPLELQYAFDRAQVVLALDADFTSTMPMSIRWARDFAARRRPSDGHMSRLYAAEPMPTPTGSLADHRFAIAAGEVADFARAILSELAALGKTPPRISQAIDALGNSKPGGNHAHARAIARDLARHDGGAIVIAGDRQGRGTHVLAHLLNDALGSFGSTVNLTEPALIEPPRDEGSSLDDLAAAIDAGEVETLVILDQNVVYNAPPHLELGRRIAAVRCPVCVSRYEDETWGACRWLVPLSHDLEAWGDARAYDGTRSFIQPLIQPLHASRSVPEILAAFAGLTEANVRELLRESLRPKIAGEFEIGWRERIRAGFEQGSASPTIRAAADLDRAAAVVRAAPQPSQAYELALESSHATYDGRFANNPWLLELPHPLTKLTWDNAAALSPRTAKALGIEDGRVVRLTAGRRSVLAPTLIVPGHADNAITLSLGFGRMGAESLARGVGANAYPLLAADGALSLTVEVALTAQIHELARTQHHDRQEGRDLAPVATLEESGKPEFMRTLREPQITMLPLWSGEGDQWAMTIDTTICTGCSACVIACQAENNIVSVGKQGVIDGREMHWIRIDRYYVGEQDPPQTVHQPMLCQHCENAPCEYVCPVYATTHSPDGLNEMTYNRCIGTRFCSNNCPYKVRRFNWFAYNGSPDMRALQHNPDVTIRGRGVMEKCTYCVQRIRRAEIGAREQRRAIAPGEVVSACAQACPTGAIKFGSLRHQSAEVVTWRAEPRAYSALNEEGTRPRTRYLAKIRTPNSEVG